MCGISGIVTSVPRDMDIIKTMNDTLSHRGPDGEGFYATDDGNVHLGHKRLSIIDLAGGQQPLHSANQEATITYNGEVYNYQEIKSELLAKGYIFKTNSDTEVILNAYLEWGAECLTRLRGMFAFAIWSAEKEELFIARDFFGIKPLYYHLSPAKFAFASELKGLLPVLDNRVLDKQALYQYLTLGYVPSPRAIYTDCFKLPPGHYLKVRIVEDKVVHSQSQYFQYQFDQEKLKNEEEILDQLQSELSNSVQAHMVSDVPIGFFLSGGIDSSLVSLFGSKVIDEPINTFSMGFEEEGFDELPYANKIAAILDSNHSTDILRPQDIGKLLTQLVHMYDEPFADSSAIPTYLVSKAIREKYKVALSGDGGDEFWAGYKRYLSAMQYYNFAHSLRGRLFIKTCRLLAKLWPFSWKKDTLKFFAQSPLERFQSSMAIFFTPQDIEKLFIKDFFSGVDKHTSIYLDEKISAEEKSNSILEQIQLTDIRTYLHEDCLTKVDRASMATSLEVRVPFIDTQLANFASKVPDEIRFKGWVENGLKYPLRKIVADHIEPEIAWLRKKGFSIPFNSWFRSSSLSHLILDKLESLEKRQAIFNKSYIKQLIHEHESEQKKHQNRLWSILFLLEWFIEFSPRIEDCH